MSKVVDFVPEINTFGDFAKISDDDMLMANSALVNLFNLMEVERGMIQEMPWVGIANILLSIFYTDKLDSVINNLSRELNKYLGYPVNVNYKWLNNDNIELTMIVTGLPVRTKVVLANVNGRAKILKVGTIDQEG